LIHSRFGHAVNCKHKNKQYSVRVTEKQKTIKEEAGKTMIIKIMTISRTRNILMSLAILALSMLAASTAQAAPIVWSGPFNIQGDTDVVNNGAAVFAYDWSASLGCTTCSSDETVNSVNFTAAGSGISAAGFGYADSIYILGAVPGNPLSTAYTDVLNGADAAGAVSCTVTLNNLTVGDVYEVQIWVDDSRGCCGTRTGTVSDSSGNNITLAYDVLSGGGGLGQYTIGTFTADAATEEITLLGNGSDTVSGGTQINAIQLRNLSITATPIIQPGGGTYVGAQTVTITSDTGSTVFYTTDGSSPSDSSLHGAVGSGSATVIVPAPTNMTINAFATNSNQAASATASATYTTLASFSAPTFAPPAGTYIGVQTVTITAPSGSTVIYTTDGSDPTTSDTSTNGEIGSGSATVIVPVLTTMTINAFATNGTEESPVASATYKTQPGLIAWNGSFDIAGDTDVATSGAVVFAYDLDGSDVTVNGVNFTGPGSGITLSGFLSPYDSYVLGTAAPATSLSMAYQNILSGGQSTSAPGAPSVSGPGTVTLNNLTVGDKYEVQIWVDDSRYAVEESETVSDTNGDAVTLIFNVPENAGGLGQYTIGTFTASSQTAVMTFRGSEAAQINAIQLHNLDFTATPAFQPVKGTYVGAQTVTITSESGSTVFYTTDGSSPSDNSLHGTVGSGSATVIVPAPTNMTINAFATNSNQAASAIASATYTTLASFPAPTFAPPAGTYVGLQTVTMTAPSGSTVIYTTDGSDPTTSASAVVGTIGSGSATIIVPVPTNMTINAYATNGVEESPVASAAYTTQSGFYTTKPGLIAWDGPFGIAGDTDVATNGTAVFAYDWSVGIGCTTCSSDETVNGVNFTAAGPGISATGFINNYSAYVIGSGAPAAALSAAYADVLNGATYAGSSPCMVTLNNLTIGDVYEVQIWVDDSRGCCGSRTDTVSDSSGNTITLDFDVLSGGGGLGQYTIGAFTADATTENITLLGNQSTQLNAIQLRLLAVPPVLSGFGPWSAGSFPLTFSGPNGKTYKVLTSTNLALPLTNWTVLTSGTFGAGAVNYTATGATNTVQFYRIEEQ
jgi:hypothetical protein